MGINNITRHIPSPLALALGVSLAISAVQAKASDIVIIPDYSDTLSKPRHCKPLPSTDKPSTITYGGEDLENTSIEAYSPGNIPSNISQILQKYSENFSEMLGDSIEDIDVSDFQKLSYIQRELESFFGFMFYAREDYTNPQVRSAQYFLDNYRALDGTPITSEEAENLHAEDQDEFDEVAQRRTSAQKKFLELFAPDGEINSYYDLLDAIQGSDDETSKKQLQFILSVAEKFVNSEVFVNYQLSKGIIAHARDSLSDYENTRKVSRIEVRDFQKNFLEQVLFQAGYSTDYSYDQISQGGIPVGEKISQDLWQLRYFFSEIFHYLDDEDTTDTFSELVSKIDCTPNNLDISKIDDGFVSEAKKNMISMRKNHDENLTELGEQISVFESWNNIFLSQLQGPRYGVDVEQVLGNLETLLENMSKDDENPLTAYNSYSDYTSIRETMNNYRSLPALTGNEERFEAIFKEVVRRQNEQLRIYKNRVQ